MARIMHFDNTIAMVEICALNGSREWHSFELSADFLSSRKGLGFYEWEIALACSALPRAGG